MAAVSSDSDVSLPSPVSPDRQSGASYEEFLEYAESLGISPATESELLWVAREAYSAPLPAGWTEYADSEGRVYFSNLATQESRWEHPADEVFRELLSLVKTVRDEKPPATEERRAALVQEHLLRAHERATAQLAGWSGPYNAADGSHYFYHAELQVSTWEDPVKEWERDLETRRRVLQWCLLDGWSEYQQTEAIERKFQRPTELPPPLDMSVASDSSVPIPHSARSFHSARSARSARSMTPATRRRMGVSPSPGPPHAAAPGTPHTPQRVGEQLQGPARRLPSRDAAQTTAANHVSSGAAPSSSSTSSANLTSQTREEAVTTSKADGHPASADAEAQSVTEPPGQDELDLSVAPVATNSEKAVSRSTPPALIDPDDGSSSQELPAQRLQSSSSTADTPPAASPTRLAELERIVDEFQRDDAKSIMEMDPSLTPQQRHVVKALVARRRGLRCESFGFGADRRLQLCKGERSSSKRPGEAADKGSEDDDVLEFTFGSTGELRMPALPVPNASAALQAV